MGGHKDKEEVKEAEEETLEKLSDNEILERRKELKEKAEESKKRI